MVYTSTTSMFLLSQKQYEMKKGLPEFKVPSVRKFRVHHGRVTCRFVQQASRVFAQLVWSILLMFGLYNSAFSQEARNPTTGLYELNANNFSLVTDIPIDDELRSWPQLLEQSVQHWQGYFQVPPERMQNLSVKVFLIQDRERFERHELLGQVPGFEEGYQFGDHLYLSEQPSVYYRRHLFLHEATHWIMWRLFGGAGSPWYMEGMADLQGTHRIQDGKLILGVVPNSSDEVPYWGRLRMIEDTLREESAPSLEQILAYQNDRDRTKRYSWSWAACLFFTTHPKYRSVLRSCFDDQLDYSDALSVELKSKLKDQWDHVLVDWNGFISDLSFGYDASRSQVVSSEPIESIVQGGTTKIQLATDRGWQSTGIVVRKGSSVQLQCNGRYTIRSKAGLENAPWHSEAQGITVKYYRGHPLGCVLASIQPIPAERATKRWEPIRIGRSVKLEPSETGLLLLKINEPSPELHDNVGAIEIEIK